MTPIQASDEVVLPGSPAVVWGALTDLAAYPEWWPRRLGLRVRSSTPGLIGSEFELRPFGGRPFCCRVEAVEDRRRIRIKYFGGFITGTGEWQLEPAGSGTRLRYVLDVQAEGRLVAWLSRILPLGRIHSRQMQEVLRQLERVCRTPPPGNGGIPSPRHG